VLLVTGGHSSSDQRLQKQFLQTVTVSDFIRQFLKVYEVHSEDIL